MSESEHIHVELLILGQAVRRMREQRSISSAELADATGMTPQRLRALEAGRLDPTYDLLLVVVEALGVRLSALMTLAEQPEAPDRP